MIETYMIWWYLMCFFQQAYLRNIISPSGIIIISETMWNHQPGDLLENQSLLHGRPKQSDTFVFTRPGELT